MRRLSARTLVKSSPVRRHLVIIYISIVFTVDNRSQGDEETASATHRPKSVHGINVYQPGSSTAWRSRTDHQPIRDNYTKRWPAGPIWPHYNSANRKPLQRLATSAIHLHVCLVRQIPECPAGVWAHQSGRKLISLLLL